MSEKEDLLIKKIGRAAGWQVLGGAWVTIVRLVSSFFLARMLTPGDFGLYGMAVIVMELVNCLGNIGMNAGIVAKKETTEQDLCTCFWSMTGVRVCLFLLTFFGAPLAGIAFGEQRLAGLLKIVSIHFLISILSVMSQTILVKRLEFKFINMITGGMALVESCIVIILAWSTNLGYWSFVVGMLLNSIVTNLAFFFFSGWYPKFVFSRDSFKYLFNFGLHGLGLSISNYLNQNIDYLVIGRILGTYQLGLYEFAYRVPNIIYMRVAQPVGMTCFPAFSQVENDHKSLFDGYLKSTKFVALITLPMLSGLAVISDVLVPVLWGEQWVATIGPLRILCICAILRCIFQTATPVLYCKKRPDIPFKISFFSLIWTFISVYFLGYFYGLLGAAWGMLLSVIPSCLLIVYVVRLIDGKAEIIFKSLHPVILSTLLSSGSAYVSKIGLATLSSSSILILGVSIFVGVVAYILSMRGLFPMLFIEIVELIKAIKR